MAQTHLQGYWARVRYIVPDGQKEDLFWQDPLPAGSNDYYVHAVKDKMSSCGLSISEVVTTAWDSARIFCGLDRRGFVCPTEKLARQRV